MKRILVTLVVFASVSNVAFAASKPSGGRMMSVGDADANNKRRLRYRRRERRERNTMIEEEGPHGTAERNLNVFSRHSPENSFLTGGGGVGGYSSYGGGTDNYGGYSGGGGYAGKNSAFPDWTDPRNVIKRAWNAPNVSPSPVTPPATTAQPSAEAPPPPPSCDLACPCCDKPEFVRAIEAYSENKCQPQQDCCSAGNVPGDNEVLALVEECGRNVAFMSYDYRGEYFGCTLGKTCKLCGDSGFGDPPLVLSDEQADACDALVRSKIDDPDNCPSTWPCN